MKSKIAACLSSEKSDWETPAALFEKVDVQFHFDLDVCATGANAKCDNFFTLNGCFWRDKHNHSELIEAPEQDGLRMSWKMGEACWMNPPYGREIGLWVRKAAEESLKGATVVALLPARPDTKWWREWVLPFASQIVFLIGRVKFVGAPTGAPFPSAVVVFQKYVNDKAEVNWWDWKKKDWGVWEL